MNNLKSKALTRIQYIYCQLAGQNLITSEIAEKQHNYELSVKKGKEKIKVLVYFGKKGVSTIVQGDINSKLIRKLEISF
jgi:hypothetical protein